MGLYETNNLASIIGRARSWSRRTFGEGLRTEANLKHIESELDEIRANPTDVEEWIDVAILAFDGAWRAGYSPQEIEAALLAKYEKNFARDWPEPLPDEPVFHKMGDVIDEASARKLLQLLMADIDYVSGNCKPNEMIGALVPKPIMNDIGRFLNSGVKSYG